jgi:hypothetical protein
VGAFRLLAGIVCLFAWPAVVRLGSALDVALARAMLGPSRNRRLSADFEPRYDLAERVIPPEIISAPALPREQAPSVLILAAARALGVATVADLADYFRLPVAETQALPYLACYMGHADLDGTQYYLRLTADAYSEVMARAQIRFAYVIPAPAPSRCQCGRA